VKWISAVSVSTPSDAAVDEVGAVIAAGIPDPDLLLVFVAAEWAAEAAKLSYALRKRFPAASIVGCTGSGVIGGGREVEDRPAIALVAATLPDVEHRVVHVDIHEMMRLETAPDAWHARFGVSPEHQPSFLVFADPFTVATSELLAALDAAWPGRPKVGGLASGATRPGLNRLFVDDRVHDGGAAIVALWGDVEVETLVAQGCRPVGRPFPVTSARLNRILTLDDRPAATALAEVWGQLSSGDRELFRRAPQIGVQAGGSGNGRSPDFLVRNILGIEPDEAAIDVGIDVEAGQIVQFHVRDARSADLELRDAVDRVRRSAAPPDGIVLISCVGRGAGFFGTVNHDAGVLDAAFEGVAIGGFFGNGEIGPIHARSWLHGYTSSIALFRARGWD
jgi:small ligand-binding sensory domain FIST